MKVRDDALGLLETHSIAAGVRAADELLKAAAVHLIEACPISPGKFLVIFCGSVGEVNLSRTMGMDGVGLYRTELMFLVEGRSPSEDLLTHHFQEILRGRREQPVNFRLLDLASTSHVIDIPPALERNPAMGMRGIRALLHEGEILRRQIRAILRAAAGIENVGVLVPFVTGVSDLQRVKAVVDGEVKYIRVTAKAIKQGLVVKAPKRNYVKKAEA